MEQKNFGFGSVVAHNTQDFGFGSVVAIRNPRKEGEE